jgi:two-component system, sensor histidine kinase
LVNSEAASMIAIPPALARRVLDSSPDALLIIDAFGSIWFANRQVSTLFDYANEEMVGESIEMLIPERFRPDHVAHRSRFVRNMHVRAMGIGMELLGRRRDGREFPLEISLNPVDDAGRTLIAAAIRDVSGIKRVEAELLVARDAMEALRELAERGNDSRRRVLEAASRELRQPLQTLARSNKTLRQLVIRPEADEALRRQEQAVLAISRTLQALLALAEVDSEVDSEAEAASESGGDGIAAPHAQPTSASSI